MMSLNGMDRLISQDERQAFEFIVKNYFRAMLDEGRAHLANPRPAFVNPVVLVEPDLVSIAPIFPEAMPVEDVKLVDDIIESSPGFLSRIAGLFKRKRENEVSVAVESLNSFPDVSRDSKMKDEDMKEAETVSSEVDQHEIIVQLPKKRMRMDNKDKEELSENERKALTLDDAGIEKLSVLFSKLDTIAFEARMAKEEEERFEMEVRNGVIENLSKFFTELESVRGFNIDSKEDDNVDVIESVVNEVIDLTQEVDSPLALKRKATLSNGVKKRRRKG